MADFSTSAELELEVPNRTLRDARSKIERELGEIEVGVSATMSGGEEQDSTTVDKAMLAIQQQTLTAQRESADADWERNEMLAELLDIADNIDDELEGGGFLSGLGGMGRGAGGAAAGGFAGSVGGGALAGLLTGGSLLAGGTAAVTIGMATLTVEGLTNEDAFTRREAREEAREVTEAGERGQLPGSRFDENAPEPINLSEEIGDFTWPEVDVEDIIMPVSQSISTLQWDVPGANDVLGTMDDNILSLSWRVPGSQDVVDEIGQSVPQFQWRIPDEQDIIDDITSSIDFAGGFGDIQIDMGDVVNDVTVDIDNIVDRVLNEAESEIDSKVSNLESRLRRALS